MNLKMLKVKRKKRASRAKVSSVQWQISKLMTASEEQSPQAPAILLRIFTVWPRHRLLSEVKLLHKLKTKELLTAWLRWPQQLHSFTFCFFVAPNQIENAGAFDSLVSQTAPGLEHAHTFDHAVPSSLILGAQVAASKLSESSKSSIWSDWSTCSQYCSVNWFSRWFQCNVTIFESNKNSLMFFRSLPLGFGQWTFTFWFFSSWQLNMDEFQSTRRQTNSYKIVTCAGTQTEWSLLDVQQAEQVTSS